MSGEAEAAGAAITAGLVAAAVDDARTGKKGKKPASGLCVNCGAALSGKYCANCGQPAQLHHALLNMVEEFVRGLIIFDSRAWRTLVMLAFRPGTLTHEYLRGKRVRYISPLALFLFSVFAMFAAFAFIGGAQIGVPSQGSRIEQVNEDIKDAEDDLAGLTKDLKDLTAAGATGGEIEAAQLQVNAETKKLDALKLALQAAQLSKAPPDTAAAGHVEVFGVEATSERTVYDEIRAAEARGDINIRTGSKSFDEKIHRDLLNPELAVYKIQNAAYKFAFLLVPISLPLVWLMFMWRRGTTLFDHTVYILYSLSFASLLFITMSVLAMIPGALPLLAAPLVLAGPVHAFFHLKGGYGLSWFSALWRLPFQLLFSLVGLILFLIAILALGLVG